MPMPKFVEKKQKAPKMSKAESSAMEHPDKPGAGAKKRKKLGAKSKTHVVMSEFKRGTLHSGSGGKVKNRKQAIAIALSEARKAKRK